MRILGLVAAVLIGVPIVEIAAFIGVAYLIGVGWALLALLATCVVGGVLMSRVGVRAFGGLRDVVAGRRMPGRDSADGVLRFVSALLLLLPGFVTDVVGALLLIRPLRTLIADRALAAASDRVPSELVDQVLGPRKVRVHRTTPASGYDGMPGETLEGEIIEPESHRRP